ncbi:DUF4142 domain-containing protein [Allokutzneria albata]|uniref:Uncharacterized conserved protein, DUF305 family n=1 Tax=Allokutzneria albata TaxID=211114 RepID=A0A1G9UHL5_ALLAB|nr:DUF4142 domain-containing protein [Allokutzneria albata]SDM59333.1 Uncharacterized conserved protein, DUF305 family [Allokutzneria albata]
MMPLRLVTAAGLAYALLMIGSSTAEATRPPSAGLTTSAEARQAADTRQGNRTDESFLQKTHQASLFGIAKGVMAVDKGRCPAVRRLGGDIGRNRNQLDHKIRQLALRARVALPSGPDPEQEAVVGGLAMKSGDGFDRAWLQAQASTHRQVLELARQELLHGQSAEAKRLARDISLTVRKHLEQVRQALRVC